MFVPKYLVFFLLFFFFSSRHHPATHFLLALAPFENLMGELVHLEKILESTLNLIYIPNMKLLV